MEEQSLVLFNYMVDELLPEIRRLVPGFDQLLENRQIAIADVAWVGIGAFAGFHKTLAASIGRTGRGPPLNCWIPIWLRIGIVGDRGWGATAGSLVWSRETS